MDVSSKSQLKRKLEKCSELNSKRVVLHLCGFKCAYVSRFFGETWLLLLSVNNVSWKSRQILSTSTKHSPQSVELL